MDNNVTPDDWESQLIDYTMGVMGPEDAVAFEAGMEECRRNLQMARDYGVVTGWMGLAASPGDPPQGHKSRLMARVETTPQATPQVQAPSPAVAPAPVPVAPALVAPRPAPAAPEASKVTDLDAYRARRRTPGWMPAALAAAAVLIIVLGVWVWNLNNSSNPPVSLASYTPLRLAAQKGYENVTAVALYNPQKNDALLVANGLPPLPAGKAYEFWFLKTKGNPDPAGTFSPDPAGTATHTASSTVAMAQYSGFAVSEEPASGSSAPTGPIVVAGTHP